MLPDKNASTSLSLVLFLSAAKKVLSLASAKGVAQGSPKWSGPRLRASSRKMMRDQSSAPFSIQVDWARARSAVSMAMAVDCCHTMPAARVATRVKMTMAISSAAPRWFCLSRRVGVVTATSVRAEPVEASACSGECPSTGSG